MAEVQEQERSGGRDANGSQRARTQAPVSSVGEDRAILLGFSMMAFSVLMFFVVGIILVKPYINSKWEEEGSCVLLHTEILDEWVDCRGVSAVPCLRVTVNLTTSNQRAFLHFDEESVLLMPGCFYIPKCQMDQTDLQDEMRKVQTALDSEMGRAALCFTDLSRHPGDVILNRKYTLRKTLLALLWPGLMLASGGLLVGLVKLTQWLAHLSSGMCGRGAGSHLTLSYNQGKLYKLIQRSPT